MNHPALPAGKCGVHDLVRAHGSGDRDRLLGLVAVRKVPAVAAALDRIHTASFADTGPERQREARRIAAERPDLDEYMVGLHAARNVHEMRQRAQARDLQMLAFALTVHAPDVYGEARRFGTGPAAFMADVCALARAALPSAQVVGATRAGSRPAASRRERHDARATSSTDPGGDDPDPSATAGPTSSTGGQS